MHNQAQTIARLKSMVFLIEEALRIADEGDSAMIGAKLSDCIDCLHDELARVNARTRPDRDTGPDTLPRSADPVTLADERRDDLKHFFK